MQNIKIPQTIGNSITRSAYLELIYDSIKKQGEKYHSIDLKGYESEKDMVHFTYGRKRCVLYGVIVNEDSFDNGYFNIIVSTKDYQNYPKADCLWNIPVNIKDFRFKTLDRIAYEVYDYCKGEDDPDYEEARKEYIAGGMDNYREFMS